MHIILLDYCYFVFKYKLEKRCVFSRSMLNPVFSVLRLFNLLNESHIRNALKLDGPAIESYKS